jgi:hypothetical protein
MSNIKIAYVGNEVIIGDFSEDLLGGWLVDNPILLRESQQGLVISELLAAVTETRISLKPSDVKYGELFTPIPQLSEQYASMFSAIITPDKKIIL